MTTISKDFLKRLGPLLTVSENWAAVQRELEVQALARVDHNAHVNLEDYSVATFNDNGRSEFIKVDDEFFASVNGMTLDRDNHFAFIGEDWFRMGWMISGVGGQELVPNGLGRVPSWVTPALLSITPGYVDFQLQPDNFIKVEALKAAVPLRWVAVAMSRRALQKLLSDVDTHIPRELNSYLSRDASVLMMRRTAISSASMSIVASLFRVPLAGQMRVKYLRSQIQALIYLALGHNWDESPIGFHGTLLQRRIIEAAEILRMRARSASFEIQDLPREIGVSRTNFHQLFFAIYGMTPGRYLLEEKMKYAAHLLASNEMPVKEIARQLGYAGGTELARAFGKWHNMTPSRYRATHWRADRS